MIGLLVLVALTLVAVGLGAFGLAVWSGPGCVADGRAEAVRHLGSLDLASFRRPPVPPAENAELRLREAGNAVSLDRTTSRLLVELLRRDDAAEIVRQRGRLSAALARNRDAIRLAAGARGLRGCDAGIDYREVEPKVPSLLAQVHLSRLVFVDAVLALDAGDVPAAVTAIEILGRQATCLEQEPHGFCLLVGASFERRQLRLVAHVAGDRRCPRDLAARLPALLVGLDLRPAFHEYLRRKAAEIAADHHRIVPPPRNWSERLAGHLVLDHAIGGGLRCAVRERAGFDIPFAGMPDELGPPRSKWQQLHWMLASEWDMGAVLRANVDGRALARLAAALRLRMLEGDSCQAAWRGIEAEAARTGDRGRAAGYAAAARPGDVAAARPFWPHFVANHDGSCKLVHPEAGAFKVGLDDSGHPLLVWSLEGPAAAGTAGGVDAR